jgi:hypothetical protein
MGDLHLQDGLFGYDDLSLVLSDEEIKKSFTQDARINVYLSSRLCDNNRSWKLLEKVANANISINSLSKIKAEIESQFSNEFCSHLKRFYNEKPARDLIDRSNHQGTLKITKPVLYIFPAREGDSAFFTINGFSILVNGGYDRVRPCFWKFVNVLHQLDSVLITHNDSDALGGLSTFFSKKLSNNQLRPTVLTVLANLVNEIKPNNVSNAAVNAISNEISASSSSNDTLSDTELILDAINKLNIKLIPLVKNNVSTPLSSQSLLSQNKYEHINLYYKLGQGSLDLYVLSPFATSSEYKEFVQQQQNHLTKNIKHHKSQLEVNQLFRNIPLTHLNSAVVLMVWLPFNAHNGHNANNQHRNSITNSSENCALRFLFTGNAPQNVIFHALEKIKDFDVISTPVYKAKSLETGSSILNPPPSVAPVPSTNAPSTNTKKTSLLPSEISKDVKSVDSKPTNTRASLQFSANKTNDVNKEKTAKETATKSSDNKDSSKPPVASSTTQPKKPVEVKKKVEEKPTSKPDKLEKEVKKPQQPTQSNKPATQKTLEIKLAAEAKPNSASKSTASATTAKSTESTKPATKPATLLATKPAAAAANNNNNKSPSTNSQAKDAVFSKKKDDKASKKEKEPAEPKSNIITKRNAKPVAASTEVPIPAATTASIDDVKVDVKEEQQQEAELTVIEKIEEARNCENRILTLDNLHDEANIINLKQDDLINNEKSEQELVRESTQQNDVQELVEEQTTTTTTEQLVVEEIVEESMTKNQSLPPENVVSTLEDNLMNSNQDDIMTRSFIEDPSNPQSNPFLSSEPIISGSESAHTIDSTSGAAVSSSNHPEELDPNRYVQNGYHQDEDYHHTNGNGYHPNGNGYHTNGNGHHNGENDRDDNSDAKFISESKQMIKNGGIDLMADTLSNELGSLNINESQQVKSNDPNTWNPLELPKPVDPTTLNTSASEKTNGTGNKKTAPVTSSPLADNSNKLKKLANSNGMNSNSQTKPLAKVQHPVYLEVCYIPNHGNGHYSDMEFFRRVRSRHYILSTQEPSEDVLNALIKAKETWEEKSLQVSIIPTYESEQLRRWFEKNEEKLAKLKIDVHPAANLATLSMDDLPDMTCQVYKLEF